MPELPEVEACRRNLVRWTEGRILDDVILLDPASVRGTRSTRPSQASPDGPAQLQALIGQRSARLERHGKRMAWWFDDGVLLLHLGMTGRWVRRGLNDPPKAARAGFRFAEDVIWFADTRRFGCVTPLSPENAPAALSEGMGPDALSAPLGGEALAARFVSRSAIKVALMDQGRIAGIGNIHAVEALFRAGIDPSTPCIRMTPPQWEALSEALVEQLLSTLAEIDGLDIPYVTEQPDANPFSVYARAGEPCPMCGAAVASGRHAGRSTFWCPGCQPSTAGLG